MITTKKTKYGRGMRKKGEKNVWKVRHSAITLLCSPNNNWSILISSIIHTRQSPAAAAPSLWHSDDQNLATETTHRNRTERLIEAVSGQLLEGRFHRSDAVFHSQKPLERKKMNEHQRLQGVWREVKHLYVGGAEYENARGRRRMGSCGCHCGGGGETEREALTRHWLLRLLGGENTSHSFLKIVGWHADLSELTERQAQSQIGLVPHLGAGAAALKMPILWPIGLLLLLLCSWIASSEGYEAALSLI